MPDKLDSQAPFNQDSIFDLIQIHNKSNQKKMMDDQRNS